MDNGTFGAFQTEKPENGASVIDYGNYQIAPGLVDTHIHGFKGADVMDNDVEALRTISEGLPSCGVTSYLPTTLTASRELLADVCQTVGDNATTLGGAKSEGFS